MCYQMECNGIAVRVASDSNGEPVIVEYEGLVVVLEDRTL